MSVYSAEYHAMVHSPANIASPASAVEQVTSSAPKSDGGGFFHHLLDVINPLQHLPIIGTLYRAITGDTMGTVAKIAGDALYGGVWGAAGAVADTAFKAVTGKDFGSTVLAFAEDTLGFGHPGAPVAVAANTAPRPAAKAQAQAVQTDGADVLAFGSALAAKGMDNEMAARVLYAYRRSQGLVTAAAN